MCLKRIKIDPNDTKSVKLSKYENGELGRSGAKHTLHGITPAMKKIKSL